MIKVTQKKLTVTKKAQSSQDSTFLGFVQKEQETLNFLFNIQLNDIPFYLDFDIKNIGQGNSYF